MLWPVLVVIANVIVVNSRSLSSIEDMPRGCEWQTQQSNEDEAAEEPVLTCQIRTINGTDNLVAGLSQNQADSVFALRLECSDVLFFESTLETAKPGSLFAALRYLKDLRVEYCKIRNIPASVLSPLRHLRHISLRSHNSDWSAMTLELHPESFLGMSQLRSLDLGDNNIWSTPRDLFCPLYSLTKLNLMKNKLQDVLALGFGDARSYTCGGTLEMLDLADNDIISLPENGFFSLKSLETLNLQDNSISKISDNAFAGLIALQKLNMSSNALSTLPPDLFRSSREVRRVYLQNNSLTLLAPGLLEGLDQLQDLDLSNNELSNRWVNKDTFRGLVRLVVLNLAYNKLNRIDSSVFHDLYTLQILNLEHNAIDFIAEGAFGELKNLHALTLSYNKLKRIESYHFNGMYALNQLLLDSNEIDHISGHAFSNVTNLGDLSLNDNHLGRVPVGLGKLRFLKTLDLGKNTIQSINNSSFEGLDQIYGLRLVDNHIVNISRDTFSTLPSLRVLNLASNRIDYVEQSAFASNPTLQAVRLDDNQLTDISGVFTNLQSLIWLNVSSNNILWFDFGHLPTSLEWLDIHDNEINELGNRFDVTNSLKIKMLDVSFNSLTEISEDSIPASIETLFLNNNKIRLVKPRTFFKKNNLEKVVLYGNDLRHLDLAALSLDQVSDDRDLPQFYVGGNPFYCDCNMEWILRINHLSNLRQYPQLLDLDSVTCELVHGRGASTRSLLELKPSNFLCPYEAHCFALCHCCDFDACDCEMTCPNNCTCYHDHTWSSNVVDCSNAGYTTVPEKIPMDATEIYLDGNNLGELGSHVFIGKKKLEVLYLNNSNIAAVNNRTFNGVKSLKVLHMENNHLEKLRGFEFDQLEKLNELYLDHNQINFLGNNTFAKMRDLEVLKLDENKIVNFAPIRHLETGLPVRVSLNGNKWSCDCVTLGQLETWLKDSGSDPAKITCTDTDETIADFVKRCDNSDNAIATSVVQKEIYKNNQLFGGNYVPLLAATLVAILIVFLIVALVFAFRQDVRLWAHSKYGIRIFQDGHSPEESEDRDRLYDCYVVYSHKDEDLASRALGPELEQNGYSLCLHYRDLHLVGGASYLVDAMVGAADASRRVVFIVSPNLLCTEWTRPEFRAALQAALTTSYRHKLICVLYGDPLEPMDPELRALLRACSVTRWGERRFWEKLRYAMPDLINNRIDRRGKKSSETRCKTSMRYTAAPTAPETWCKYTMPPSVHGANLTPTPTQSTYVSGDSARSTEDEGCSSASSQHYGSEQLNHSYVSIDGRPPQYTQLPPCREPHHVYSTIPESQPQSRTYFV